MWQGILKRKETQTVTIGGLQIVKTARRKSIALKPTSAGIELHVPRHLTEAALKRLLNRQQAWIDRHYRRIEAERAEGPEPFAFRDGAPLAFLGQPCFLKLDGSDRKQPLQCHLQDNTLRIEANPDKRRLSREPLPAEWENRLAQTLQAWFVRQGEDHFQDFLPPLAEEIGVDYRSVTVKNYKARWGSCYPDGRIQFNWKLMQAPEWVVEYVAVHELCHRVHANHSPAFWRLVEQHCPHTAQAKLWLKKHGAGLIQFLS